MVILISMYVTKVSYRFLGGDGWGKGVLRASTDLGPNYITDTLGPPPFLCHIQLCLCSYIILWGGGNMLLGGIFSIPSLPI